MDCSLRLSNLVTPCSGHRRVRYLSLEVCGKFYLCKHFHVRFSCRLLQHCHWLTAVLTLLHQSWQLLVLGESLDIASSFQRRTIANFLSFVRITGFFPGCFPWKYQFLFLFYALGSLLTLSLVLTWTSSHTMRLKVPADPVVWPFKWKLLSTTFLRYSLFCFTRWF